MQSVASTEGASSHSLPSAFQHVYLWTWIDCTRRAASWNLPFTPVCSQLPLKGLLAPRAEYWVENLNKPWHTFVFSGIFQSTNQSSGAFSTMTKNRSKKKKKWMLLGSTGKSAFTSWGKLLCGVWVHSVIGFPAPSEAFMCAQHQCHCPSCHFLLWHGSLESRSPAWDLESWKHGTCDIQTLSRMSILCRLDQRANVVRTFSSLCLWC